MSRPRLPLSVNKAESVEQQQEAMIGIEPGDVRERQSEPYLKMTTEKKAEIKCGSDGDINMLSEDKPRHQKRRKTRRGRAKRRKSKPYSKTFWEDKKLERERRRRPVNDALTEVFIHGQPVAPYNTTQFLIDDHNSFPDIDVQLQTVGTVDNPNSELVEGASIRQKPSRPPRPTRHRNRDSSFSVDSDEDYFYSSPEDEEEFLTKEFSNTYEDLHAERLGSLPKAQLIQDYVQLEGKVEMLEKKLQRKGPRPNNSEIGLQVDSNQVLEQDNNSMRVDESVNVSLEDYNKVLMDNERLKRENERLRHLCSKADGRADADSVSSSVDSESDSSSSSCSTIGEESVGSSDRTDASLIDSKTLSLDASK